MNFVLNAKHFLTSGLPRGKTKFFLVFFSETISRESKVGHCLLAPLPPVYAVVFILGSQEKNIYLPSQIQWKNMTSFEVNLRGWISIIQNNYFLFSYFYIVNICIRRSKEVNYYLKYEGKNSCTGCPNKHGTFISSLFMRHYFINAVVKFPKCGLLFLHHKNWHKDIEKFVHRWKFLCWVSYIET